MIARTSRCALMFLWIAVTMFGTMLPAQAAYADTATAQPMTITTVDVAAPTNLLTNGTKCTADYDRSTNAWTTTLNSKLSWTGSSSRGVSGYRVTAVFTDGTRFPVAQVGAGATSLTGYYDASYGPQNIRLTVTTLTSYGWTEESSFSGIIRC
jgi:hypothetical protein